MIEEKNKREKRDNCPKRDNTDTERGDSFIMLPTVDFCFKEQMKSAERRGEKRALKKLVHKKIETGKSLEEIAEFMEMDLSEVQKLMEE